MDSSKGGFAWDSAMGSSQGEFVAGASMGSPQGELVGAYAEGSSQDGFDAELASGARRKKGSLARRSRRISWLGFIARWARHETSRWMHRKVCSPRGPRDGLVERSGHRRGLRGEPVARSVSSRGPLHGLRGAHRKMNTVTSGVLVARRVLGLQRKL